MQQSQPASWGGSAQGKSWDTKNMRQFPLMEIPYFLISNICWSYSMHSLTSHHTTPCHIRVTTGPCPCSSVSVNMWQSHINWIAHTTTLKFHLAQPLELAERRNWQDRCERCQGSMQSTSMCFRVPPERFVLFLIPLLRQPGDTLRLLAGLFEMFTFNSQFKPQKGIPNIPNYT